MALYDGIDTIAFVSHGVYCETYVTETGGENIASLFCSWGLLEEAPVGVVSTGFFRKIFRNVLREILRKVLKSFV